MEYADSLEGSGKNLVELLNTSPSVLTGEYGMKRGHVARFLDRASACGVQMPKSLVLPARKRTLAHLEGEPFEDEQPKAGAAYPKPAPEAPLPVSSEPESEASELDQVYPGMKMVTGPDGQSTTLQHTGGYKHFSPVFICI